MKMLVLSILVTLFTTGLFAQEIYFTKTGTVDFVV